MKKSKDSKSKTKSKTKLHPMQEELIDKISEAREEAKSASSRAKKIDKDMQSVIDEADVTIPLIPFMKPQNIEGLVSIWNSVGYQASRNNSDLDRIQGSTDGTVSTTSTSTISISGAFLNGSFLTDNGEFDQVWGAYVEFTSRPDLRNEVVQLLKDYGFDKAQIKDEKSPLEQFETAHKAYDNPVTTTNPISTSLIPLRECIKTIVDALLRLRPSQEKTGNEKQKILSIGMQLKKDELTEDVISEWADEWHNLNYGDLSTSKRKHVEREGWLVELNRGTSFLRSLLRGLDSNKFRK